MKTKLLLLLLLANFSIHAQQNTSIPDLNFENKLIALGIDSGIPDGKVLTSAISGLTILNIDRSSISDLTGIEDFKALTTLYCPDNNLTNLDLSQNINLESITANKNKLTAINISKNNKLTYLNIGNNKLANLDIKTNTLLENLDCQNNLLTTIDLSENTILKSLNVSKNTLTALNVSKNSALTGLFCNSCTLTSLDIDNNTALQEINCGSNQLTSINILKNINLTNFYCHFNKITSLDVSNNILLKWLLCHGNKLTAINVSMLPDLEMLDCQENQLKNIDVSNNPKLIELVCNDNQLISLNLKNKNNTNLDLNYSLFTNNPNLTCIQVDNEAYSDANWTGIKDANASYSSNCVQYTLIPDLNFENKLIALGIDSGIPDGKVETSKIESVTSLDISYSEIKNITGIEDFTSLTSLICNDNEINVLNISKNTKLQYLDCSSTMVYLLDFSNNPELTHINVSKNPYVTKIDVSNNLKLTSLNCSTTSISRLDVSKNTKLTTLNCKQVYIMDLDLSYNTALTSLDCSDNYNSLTTLNLKNGNNSNFILANSNFTNNAYLTCITVDNQNYSNDNWSSLKDASASYNTSCLDGPYTLIPDPNFEKALIKSGVDYRELDGKVLTANILLVTAINLSGSNINDLTGIEGFLNLETLNCKTNNLTNLDLSQNVNLKSLDCSENKLVNLNLSNKPNFVSLKSTLNPSLTCIKVDNTVYSETNWTAAKDAATNYSTSCNLGLQDSVFSYAVLSPNPTKGEVTINNISLEKANVYNTLGQLVRSFTLNSSNTDNSINLSGLPKGIYYIYLINGDASTAKKIIVE